MTIIEHFLLMVFSTTFNNILVYIVVGISYWWMKPDYPEKRERPSESHFQQYFSLHRDGDFLLVDETGVPREKREKRSTF
jgi:hypothetical protein